MKIVRIGYGETISTGNYENMKPYFEAELEDWEDPLKSLEILKQMVKAVHRGRTDLDDIFEQKLTAERRISWINDRIKSAKKRWQDATKSWQELIAMFKSVGLSQVRIDQIEASFPQEPNFTLIGEEPEEEEEEEEEEDDDDNEY
ncbi:hypothetical protein [Floridanema evergladense]|uniref:Uncharacterized protein n=1 Tax=Floridaenema evergladense BLCC-F167 TaxID=3153639 RepID=A0ABV4WEG6_9CYAN